MALAALLTLAACGGGSPSPASGSLDPGFAAPLGYANFSIPGVPGIEGTQVAVQADGSIVVAGVWTTFSGDSILVARFTPDGLLDPSFGLGGIVNYASSERAMAAALGLALQADGKILVAGEQYGASGSSPHDVIVMRLNALGGLDTAFGTNGVFTYNRTGTGTDIGFAVRVQGDGKILVSGMSGAPQEQQAMVLRLTAAGALDTRFASGGVFLQPAAPAGPSRFLDVRVLESGAILAAGSSGDEVMLVVKLDAQGDVDASFGTGGTVTLSVPGGAATFAYGICSQADGKVVLAGAGGIRAEGLDTVATRILASGALDTTFGASGWFVHEVPGKDDDVAFACDVRPDGKILLGGSVYDSAVYRGVAIRLTPTGTLDTGFGVGGVTLLTVGDGDFTFVRGMAVQSDGKLLLTGSSKGARQEERMLLARFLP